jgi:hypothetical protein
MLVDVPDEPTELGPKMEACSERERKFVWAYLVNGGNQSEAARSAGYSDHLDACKVRGHYLIHRQRVIDALQEVYARHLVGMAGPAIAALDALVRNDKHPDHAKAIGMVLNRAGMAERSAVDVNVNATVTLNATDSALEDLRILKALGTSREKLIETFGESALQRLEAMLPEQAKVIEHDGWTSR